jgi:hypothetical protein
VTSPASQNRWLVLIHQLPPKPSYARVKVWRRLQALGAVALKNSVYVLPNRDGAREDFEWLSQEVQQLGGSATVCEARLVQGFDDQELEELFNAAREADYRQLLKDVRQVEASLRPTRRRAISLPAAQSEVAGLRKRHGVLAAIDFFGARGGEAVEAVLAELERTISRTGQRAVTMTRPEDLHGRVWVTRTGVHVDRIASAWLIRRFIDPDARFKFVAGRGYAPEPGELRFDMFEAEFTHQGDLCTFEVLCAQLDLADAGLRAIGEIVHDIDLKEDKHARPEVAGVARVLAGLAKSTREDPERIERGSRLFDDLYESFRSTSARKPR